MLVRRVCSRTFDYGGGSNHSGNLSVSLSAVVKLVVVQARVHCGLIWSIICFRVNSCLSVTSRSSPTHSMHVVSRFRGPVVHVMNVIGASLPRVFNIPINDQQLGVGFGGYHALRYHTTLSPSRPSHKHRK